MNKLLLLATCVSLFSTPLAAQQPSPPLQPIIVQSAAPASQLFLPANTEVVLSVNNDVTTKGGSIEEGSMFSLTVTSDVRLGNYIVIPKGSRGIGEITWKTGKGAFGKSGKMEVELRYVEVGGQRIPIEGKYRQEGEGNTVATVGGVILVGVFAGFITGKSARIPRGRELVAVTRDPVPVAMPVNYTGDQNAMGGASMVAAAATTGAIAPLNVGGGPPRRPAKTRSGFCYDVPRNYAGTGSLDRPALTSATPSCAELLER
jgi:hypothetical protein